MGSVGTNKKAGGLSISGSSASIVNTPVSTVNGNTPTQSDGTETTNGYALSLVPYTANCITEQQFVPLVEKSMFNDIRNACQSAQTRIMRLQQATRSHVNLDSSTRDGWFDELRNIAQCFITAQQAAAKIEQAVNTERNQLQGSLSSALNERDVRTVERESANQEIEFLRFRVAELGEKIQALEINSIPTIRISPPHEEKKVTIAEPLKSNDQFSLRGWIYSNGGCSDVFHDDDSADMLSSLPSKVEDMPPSPKLKGRGSPFFVKKYSFGPHDAVSNDSASKASTSLAATTAPTKTEQSKFFKNGAAVKNNSGIKNGNRYGTYLTPTPIPAARAPINPPSSSAAANRPSENPKPIGFRNRGDAKSPAPSNSASKSEKGQNYVATEKMTKKATLKEKAKVALPMQKPKALMASSDKLVPAGSREVARLLDPSQSLAKFAPGVPLKTPDDDRVTQIFEFFNSVKEWVSRHCGSPNMQDVKNMSKHFPRLWDYACTTTYPDNRSNASSHSQFMLGNKKFRVYFVSRLVIQFVVQKMWTPQAWEGLDPELTKILVDVRERLDPNNANDTVLKSAERHQLVEKRACAIYEFMRHPTWQKVRSQKTNQNMARFKDIVGPMMNTENLDRQGALHELSGICETGLRLSAILNISRLSFQFIFNECGIKFSDQTHRALNTNIASRDLQAQHWRLMQVVTPGITYRNDGGNSLDPRFLAKANVLLMQ